MNKLKYILLLLLPLFMLNACGDDDGKNPAFGEDEIYLQGDWSVNRTSKIGNTLKIEAPKASPYSDDLKYEWTLDGKVISTVKDLEFKIGEYYFGAELIYTVTRSNGTSTFRKSSLLVTKDFVPKVYTKKTVAYFTCTGTVKDIDWENITHLIVTSVIVNAKLVEGVETGEWFLDDSALKDIDVSNIVAHAHHHGVTVLLQFSPRFAKSRHEIPQMDGRHIWSSLTFYNAAVNNRDALIKAMVDKAATYGVDGVDIHMNKSEDGAFKDPVALKSFYETFAQKSPKNVTIERKEYPYLLTQTTHGGWARAAMTEIYKLPQYSWVNMTYFGYVDLNPADPALIGDTNGAVNGMTASWGVGLSPERLVLVVPAYAVRFFGTPPFTWGNLDDQTEYFPYKNVFARYPNANDDGIFYAKGSAGVAGEVDVIYYEGLDKITAKVVYAVDQKKIAGMGIWSIESDSHDAKSITRTINGLVGNDFSE